MSPIPKASCMTDDQTELHEVNPALGTHLTSIDMRHLEPGLAKIGCVDLDDLAVRLVTEDASLAIMSQQQCERLRNHLDLRGVLRLFGLEIAPPLVALTEFAPTRDVLQAHPWSLIQEKLGQIDRDHLDLVQRVWELENPLRVQIREGGLDPVVADQNGH